MSEDPSTLNGTMESAAREAVESRELERESEKLIFRSLNESASFPYQLIRKSETHNIVSFVSKLNHFFD
jgi:hypothetical protein